MNISQIFNNGINKIAEKASEVVQKEVESSATYNYQEILSVSRDNEPVTYEDPLLKTSENTVKKEDKGTTAAEEEERLKNIGGLITEKDVESLTNEGMTLEKYNAERLDRALSRIKKQRAENEDNLNDQTQNIKEKKESIVKMADNGQVDNKVVDKLLQQDLPVTDENLAKVANAMGMTYTAIPISETAKSYLIKNNMDPTIENIYKAQYSGSKVQGKEISKDVWNNLQGQVKDIITNAGLEVNEENTLSAKWLVNNQLPVTEDNLWALRDLNEVNEGISEDELLDKTTEALKNGNSAESALLGNAGAKRVEQIINKFNTISDEAVELVSKENQNQKDSSKINLRMLADAQGKLDEKQTKVSKETQSNSQNNNSKEESSNSENIDIQSITVRRQLEEIRLKMTLEAGQQLSKNGINLETDSLNNIVEGLKDIESQYYSNLLKESNTTVNTENIEILRASILDVEELQNMPSYILGSTLTNRSQETINGLLTAGAECKTSLAKVNESYEALMTSPRTDMGDSISKAFQNVDDILTDLDLETTSANQRAVRILGYNQMEITRENIDKVKVYDSQVNYMMKKLQPAVTVELIKQGINPTEMPIEELNNQIDEIKKDIGVSEEEKYSKYLWKLEKEKGLTEEEKKSYIGIYRLLNAVEKTDGAAIGAVVNANQDVTMSHLLTAVRTIKNGGIKTSIDDSFGTLEDITFTRERITDQIAAAFAPYSNTSGSEEINTMVDGYEEVGATSENLGQTRDLAVSMEEKMGYMSRLLQTVMEEITPAKLQQAGDMNDLLNMSIEKLKGTLENTPDNEAIEQEYWTQKTIELQNTADASESALGFLRDYSIPDSISNIQAAKDLLSGDQSLYKQWKTQLDKEKVNTNQISENSKDLSKADISVFSEDLINSLSDSNSMIGQYDKIEQAINKQINNFYESQDIKSEDISALQRINNGVSFLQNLAKREYYEIPILVGDKVTNVNVTILRNSKDSGKVNISVQSDTLGKISAGFSVKNQTLKGLITCDNRLGLEAIQSESTSFEETITQEDLEVKQINYGIDNKSSERYNSITNRGNDTDKENKDEDQGVATNSLYKIAKSFLIQIRSIELKNAE